MDHLLSLVFYAVVAVWGLFEIGMAIFLRARGAETKKRDAGTFNLIWLTIGVSVAAGVWLGMRGIGRVAAVHPIAAWVGLGVIVLGLVVRLAAILTLRRFFTVNVAVQKDHRVVQTGLYRFMRHPSYTGSLLSFVGLGVACESWVSLLVIAVPVTTVFLLRIRVEERALLEGLGEAYAEYAGRTKRLVPFVY